VPKTSNDIIVGRRRARCVALLIEPPRLSTGK
jgi:hypothetical protein